MESKKLLKKMLKDAIENVSNSIIAESPKRRWIESDVTLRSGKCVKFGCKAHISDIDRIINDLTRIRARQSAGSVTRARISDAIRALRRELKAAQKKYEESNPHPPEDLQ